MSNEQKLILSEVNRSIGVLMEKLGPRVWIDSRADFAQELQSKYGVVECEQYYLFHVMIGGGPGTTQFFDFPEPDSIQKWIERRLQNEDKKPAE